MQKINLRLSFLFFTVFFCSFGQEQLLLNQYFSQLEKNHNVNFNYIDQDIEGIQVDTYKSDLKSVLKHISQQAPLKFNFIDDRNIVVNLSEDYYAIQVEDDTNTKLSEVAVFFKDKEIGKTNSTGLLYCYESELGTALTSVIEFYKNNFKLERVLLRNLDKNSITKIRLTQQIELESVEVLGYLTKGINLNDNFSISLKPKEFEILPGLTQPDVIRTMQLLPGVVSLDERISNLNVRGGTHDQNLFLWNSARLYQTGHFFGMISALNPSIAHDIRIYKNGSSSFFTEGISSVVDISSSGHDNNNTDFDFFINFFESSARADLNLSDSSHLRVAGRYALSGFVDTPTFQNYYDKIFQNTEISSFDSADDITLSSDVDLNYHDASIQYELDINDSSTLEFNALSIVNELKFSEQNLNTLEFKDNELKQESYIASGGLKKIFNSNFSGSANAHMSYYRLRGENALTQTSQQLNQTNSVLDLGLKLRGDYKLNDFRKLSVGYQFSEIGIRNDNFVTNPDVENTQKSVIDTHSAIVEVSSTDLNNKLTSIVGLRSNYYNDYSKFVLEPHLNITYKFNPYHSLSLMAEQKHQITSQTIDLQGDFFGVENRRWVLANNEDIPILRLSQVELGYQYQKNNLLMTANVFYKHVEGITTNSQNFLNQLEFLQFTGDYTTKGVELFIQKNIEKLRYWISYAFNTSDYEFTTFTPSIFPNNFETSHQVHFGFSYVLNVLKLGVSAQYFTGRPITLIDAEMPLLNPETEPTINFLSPNSSNLEDYKQINLTASYYNSWKSYNYEFGLSLLNVFDSSALTNQFYRLDNDKIEINTVENRSLALTPNVFFRLNF